MRNVILHSHLSGNTFNSKKKTLQISQVNYNKRKHF